MKLILAGLFFQVLTTSMTWASLYSVGEVAYKWDKKEIIVCWQDEEPVNQDFHPFDQTFLDQVYKTSITLNTDTKKTIQKFIEEEFRSDNTGIHFVGWKTCQINDKSDTMLIVGTDRGGILGQASIGLSAWNEDKNNPEKGCVLRTKNQKSYVFLDASIFKKSEEYFKITTLHEFGHLAGLRHEDMRRRKNIFDEQVTSGTTLFSPYDINSMMSYEFMHRVLPAIGDHFYTISDKVLRKKWEDLYPEKRVLEPGIIEPYLKDTRQFYGRKMINKYVTEYFVRIGFSNKDIHGLRCLYVYDEKMFKGLCHK